MIERKSIPNEPSIPTSPNPYKKLHSHHQSLPHAKVNPNDFLPSLITTTTIIIFPASALFTHPGLYESLEHFPPLPQTSPALSKPLHLYPQPTRHTALKRQRGLRRDTCVMCTYSLLLILLVANNRRTTTRRYLGKASMYAPSREKKEACTCAALHTSSRLSGFTSATRAPGTKRETQLRGRAKDTYSVYSSSHACVHDKGEL